MRSARPAPSLLIERSRRHARVFSYPLADFDFPQALADLLGVPSDLACLGAGSTLPRRTRETDQATDWHRLFYSRFASLARLYLRFITTVATPFFQDAFFYQAVPTFRIHLPGNLAVGEFHCDSDYGHPLDELTFWVPLTRAFATNSIWVESEPRRGDYCPVEAEPGTYVVFDAARLRHGNRVNETGRTRVSFDFRCIAAPDLPHTVAKSINAGLAFTPGEYYARESIRPRS
jgi:hypothetical protein